MPKADDSVSRRAKRGNDAAASIWSRALCSYMGLSRDELLEYVVYVPSAEPGRQRIRTAIV